MDKLLQFQVNTINRMINVESNNYFENRSSNCYNFNKEIYSFGFLTNKSGSGKTRCIIELCKHECKAFYYSQNLITWDMPFNFNRYKLPLNYIECPNTNIVCVQYSTFSQWKHALNIHFEPQQVMYVQTRECLNNLINLATNYYTVHSNNIDSISYLFENMNEDTSIQIPRIILIKNTLFNLLSKLMKNIPIVFDRIFFDDYTHIELQNIPRPIISKFTWFISGTVNDIYSHNHLSIFKRIRSSISSELYNHINVCMTNSNINKYFNPIEIHINWYKFPTNLTTMTNSNLESMLKHRAYLKGIFTIKSKIFHNKLVQNISQVIHVESDIKIKNTLYSQMNSYIERYNDQTCIVCLELCNTDFCLLKCCHRHICINCLYDCIHSKIFDCPTCRTPIIASINYYLYECLPSCSYFDSIVEIINKITYKSHILIYYDEYTYDNLDQIISSKCQIKAKSLVKGNETAISYNINKHKNGELNALIINKLDAYFGYDLKHVKTLIIIKTKNIYTPFNSIIGKCQRLTTQYNFINEGDREYKTDSLSFPSSGPLQSLSVYIVTNTILDLSGIDYEHNIPS